MQPRFYRRFALAMLLLAALIIGPFIGSAPGQVSVSIHIPFGNVSDAKSEAGSNQFIGCPIGGRSPQY